MIARQLETVRAAMLERPAGLVRHVERVLAEALPLARVWLADEARVELAVWGHDLFRAEPPREQLRLARETGVPIDATAAGASPILLHGPVAAAVLRERFGVADEETLAAVRDHTAGLDRMSLIARILLIADKVEANKRRRAPALAAVRMLARRDLDTAILCWSDWRWGERGRGSATARRRRSARTGGARQTCVAEHHRESGHAGARLRERLRRRRAPRGAGAPLTATG